MSIITLFNMESVGVHSEPELLWTNETITNPTDNSSVKYPQNGVSQTIALDLSPYKALSITSAKVRVYGGSTNSETGVTSPPTVIIDQEVTHYVLNENDDTKIFSLGPFGNAFYRPVVVTNDGVTIYSAEVYESTYPDAQDSDSKYIPSKIYGIR